ncbi:uncharacterized protein LOC134726870 [Mytilus trossulus]|uniref:uncharacterized protein LOC134726870 n=1 Tax=Mytilus trossulus TaxID=6551 RepID=UPI00300406E7
MNVTVTIQPEAKANHTVTVVLTALAGLTVLVDISYIIVCFKALKKTFHNLMILAILFSDSILGISSALFSLSSVIQHKFIGSCLVQIFLFSFGIQLNYCLVFLLCLQRFFVVKSFNFGTNARFDRNKFIHIGVAILLSFIFALLGLILTPKAEYMQVCTSRFVFGDSYYIYVLIIYMPITVIIIVLSIMSTITGFRLWKIYFKRTIAPIQGIREDVIFSDRMQSSCSKTNQCSNISHSNAFGNKIQDEDKDTEILDIEIKIVTSNTEVNGEGSEVRKPCKMNSSQSCNVLSCPYCHNSTMMNIKKHSYSSTDDNKISANQDNKNMFQVRKTVQRKSERSSSKKNKFPHMENSKEIVDLKHYRNINPFTTSTDEGRSFDASRRLKKSWEIRAFLTTIIVAFQTIILTGPFVASFWIEAFSNAPLTLQFRLLLFIPFLINCISNPFIYAWRIPEIRHEFKKLFRINN